MARHVPCSGVWSQSGSATTYGHIAHDPREECPQHVDRGVGKDVDVQHHNSSWVAQHQGSHGISSEVHQSMGLSFEEKVSMQCCNMGR